MSGSSYCRVTALALSIIGMGKHLSPAELDNIQKWKSKSWTPVQIHAQLAKDRKRKRQRGPDLTTARRFAKGKTFKRSAVETRCRKRVLSDRNLATMDRARDTLITKADGERDCSPGRAPGLPERIWPQDVSAEGNSAAMIPGRAAFVPCVLFAGQGARVARERPGARFRAGGDTGNPQFGGAGRVLPPCVLCTGQSAQAT